MEESLRSRGYALCRLADTIHRRCCERLVRLHRLHDNKQVVEVYDYADPNVRMLAPMFERRLKGYAAMGYKIGGGLPDQPRLP